MCCMIVVRWFKSHVTVSRSMTQRRVPNLPAYTVVNLFYRNPCGLVFVLVHFLPEGNMLDVECISTSPRWSLSKFRGFPRREELEFFHCDWQVGYYFISCWSMSKHRNGGVANLIMQEKKLRERLFVWCSLLVWKIFPHVSNQGINLLKEGIFYMTNSSTYCINNCSKSLCVE